MSRRRIPHWIAPVAAAALLGLYAVAPVGWSAAADRGASGPSPYFRNCAAARAAGAAPIRRGAPGYRAPLDRDGDGGLRALAPLKARSGRRRVAFEEAAAFAAPGLGLGRGLAGELDAEPPGPVRGARDPGADTAPAVIIVGDIPLGPRAAALEAFLRLGHFPLSSRSFRLGGVRAVHFFKPAA
jgi:hypothetical protein